MNSQIHQHLNRTSNYKQSYEDLSWRVDLISAKKRSPNLNEPLVLFELDTKMNLHQNSLLVSRYSDSNTYPISTKNVIKSQFQMDNDELDDFLKKLNEVQQSLDKLCEEHK